MLFDAQKLCQSGMDEEQKKSIWFVWKLNPSNAKLAPFIKVVTNVFFSSQERGGLTNADAESCHFLSKEIAFFIAAKLTLSHYPENCIRSNYFSHAHLSGHLSTYLICIRRGRYVC